MDTLGDRLKKARDICGCSQKQASNDLDIAQNTLSRYETGERNPDPATLARLADYYKVSADYLLVRIDNPAASLNDVPESTTQNAVLPLGDAKKIPIYNLEPKDRDEIFAQENVIGWEPISADMLETKAILINDDSMSGSRITTGDRVIIRDQNTFEDGQTVLVQLPDKSMLVRKATHTRDGIILSPDNSAYKPQHFKSKDLKIIGIVTQVHFDYI